MYRDKFVRIYVLSDLVSRLHFCASVIRNLAISRTSYEDKTGRSFVRTFFIVLAPPVRS